MATARRMLNQHNMDKNMDRDPKKLASKGGLKPMRTGITRTALGDIRNVTKERNYDGKLAAKTKKVQPQKSAALRDIKDIENQDAENKDIAGMVRNCKAMSICENEPVARDVKAMSICEVIPPTITDIDKESEKDPYQCSEYAADIYSYLRKIEQKLSVGDYMSKQTEINERMRSILVDWLIQVHGRFGLLQETLYLTVNLIDRFLEDHVVSRSQLQLVGVSAMLLASKYEETYAPEIGDFVYITDNSYSKGQIKKMEQLILKTIKYDISNPLCLHFLRRNSKAAVPNPAGQDERPQQGATNTLHVEDGAERMEAEINHAKEGIKADAKKHTLAKYIMEITLIDYRIGRMLPSKVAAAALYLAGKLLENADWTETLVHYSTYAEQSLLPVVRSIAKIIAKSEASRYQASRTKYASNKFMRISAIEELKSELITKLAQE